MPGSRKSHQSLRRAGSSTMSTGSSGAGSGTMHLGQGLPSARTAPNVDAGMDKDDENILLMRKCLGYRTHWFLTSLYYLFGVCTAGLFLLLCRWLPRFRISISHVRAPFSEASGVLVQDVNREWVFCAMQKKTVLDEDGKPQELRYFVFRSARFFHNAVRDFFYQRGFDSHLMYASIHDDFSEGLSSQAASFRQEELGENVIDVHVKSPLFLLIDEILHPFYIFQVFSVLVWCMDDYYVYAGCIAVVATISAIVALIDTRRNLLNLREMARHEAPVVVKRNGEWVDASSVTLVPGDILEITNDMSIPCDLVLLSGQAIMNESMLTGESIPVVKSSLPYYTSNAYIYSVDEDKKHTLYSGTKVIQTRYHGSSRVSGMVVRTGFDTAKGKLMRSILYPKPSHFKFYEDSWKFVGVLFGIALCGFMISLENFIAEGVTAMKIFVRCADLITVAVPPALPVAMTVGTMFALSRLKKQSVFCISPPRVNVAGKVNVCLFDKTGTLTTEGLDVLGVLPVLPSTAGGQAVQFGQFCESIKDVPSPDFLTAMASCHGLTYVEGELIGDPLDSKIFEGTGWILEEFDGDHAVEGTVPAVVRPGGLERVSVDVRSGAVSGKEVGLLRRHDFSSKLQRMSVLTRDLSESNAKLQLKGSPEIVRELSLPETIPENFHEILKEYTHKGYRVLAYGVREFSEPLFRLERQTRKDMEGNLRFLGLVVMQNKLKDDTCDCIDELAKAGIRSIMVTGDNPLTAVSVARECRILSGSRRTFLSEYHEDEWNEIPYVEFVDVEDSECRLNPETLLPPHHVGGYEIAVTGKCFEILCANHSANNPDPLLQKLVMGTPVFARMSPYHKTKLVQLFSEMGLTTCMCGDGANDCGALKASHVGMSLSEAEASIAAPFTSHVDSIRSVIHLLMEGRAALVTSFSLFKFMALYSLIQFTTVMSLYRINSNLGNYQFLYIDMLVILPLTLLMGHTAAYPKLSKRRPAGSLFSRFVFLSLFGHTIFTVVFQVAAWYMSLMWYTSPEEPQDENNIHTYECTFLFFVSSFQYIFVCVAFNVGKPFRRSMFSNIPLTIYLVFSVAMTSYLVIGPASWTNSIMQFMTDISTEHRLIVMGVVLGNLLATLVFEWLIAPLSCWKVLLSCCKLPSCTRITQSLCCCVCRRASSSSEEREVDMTMLPPTSSTDLDWLQLMSDAALSGKSNRGGGKFVGTPPSPQLTTTRPRSPLSAAVVGSSYGSPMVASDPPKGPDSMVSPSKLSAATLALASQQHKGEEAGVESRLADLKLGHVDGPPNGLSQIEGVVVEKGTDFDRLASPVYDPEDPEARHGLLEAPEEDGPNGNCCCGRYSCYCVSPCSRRFVSPDHPPLSEDQIALLRSIGKTPNNFKLHRLRRAEFLLGWKEHAFS